MWDDQSKSKDNQKEQNMKIKIFACKTILITGLIKYLETKNPLTI